MRRPLFFVTALLLGASLAGCVRQSESYYIDTSDHALTLRADQQYFWQDSARLTLVAARLPDCQRQIALGEMPADELAVELYAAGGNLYNLRAGSQTWQVDTTTCAHTGTPEGNALGQPLGSFMLDDQGKMVFAPAAAQPAR